MRDRRLQLLAGLAFFLLFPGFFAYQMLLAMGAIPEIAGGLYGPVTAIVTMVFLSTLPFFIKEQLNVAPIFFCLVLLLMIYVAVWTLVNYLGNHEQYIAITTFQSWRVLIFWCALFFVGLFIPVSNRWLTTAIVVSFASIACFMLYFVLSTGHITFYVTNYFKIASGTRISTYQGFSRSAMLISIFLIANIKSLWKSIFIIAVATFVLFTLGARSELFGFLIFSVCMLFIYSLRRPKWLLALISISIITSTIVVTYYNVISKSRQFGVFSLTHDQSWIARQEFLKVTINQIINHPILGQFGGYAVANESTGSYAHNLLSAWSNYGLIGMLLYTSLIISALIATTYSVFRTWPIKPIWAFAFGINVVSFILVIVSKSVFWSIPAFGWGLYMNAKRSNRLTTLG